MSTQKPRERKSMTIIFIECIGLTVKVTFKILFFLVGVSASASSKNNAERYRACNYCYKYREFCTCSNFHG